METNQKSDLDMKLEHQMRLATIRHPATRLTLATVIAARYLDVSSKEAPVLTIVKCCTQAVALADAVGYYDHKELSPEFEAAIKKYSYLYEVMVELCRADVNAFMVKVPGMDY